ncbi:MAG: hypothetical protein FWD33_01575 [Alphaproteobacteria bacterium]|nr:hypothetical protein [Alphaproteobacteria bacterium]
MSYAIEVKNLSKYFRIKKKQGFLRSIFFPKYKIKKAVDKLSFRIKQGERIRPYAMGR